MSDGSPHAAQPEAPVAGAFTLPIRSDRVPSGIQEPGSLTEDAAWSDSADAKFGLEGATKSYIPLEDQVGFQLPERFAFAGLLGRGALGQVIAARDRTLDRVVAIKFLDHRHAGDSRKLSGFIREAAITARLEHSAILPVHELACTQRGELFFAMRRASGISLAEAIRLEAAGHPPAIIAGLDRKLDVVLRACDAVAYAHAQGVIHRDLKPDNIVFAQFGEVVVLDWGAASTAESRLYETPRLVGTPAYMAPEQARGEPADERSDLYALGGTLFHLLTGRHPCWASDGPSFWAKRRQGIIDPLSEAEAARLPEALLAVVLRALAADPAARQASVVQFQGELRSYQSHAESLRLTEIAGDERSRAEVEADYGGFAQAEMSCAHAGELWADNPALPAQRAAIRTAHARCAIAKGDLELAESLIDPALDQHRTVAEELAQARVRQAAARNRLVRLRLAAAALVLVVATLVAFSIHQYSLRFGAWTTVWERDFTQPGATTEGIVASRLNPKDRLVPGPIDQQGLHLEKTQLTYLDQIAIPGDVRVEVVMSWDHTVDGLGIQLNASDPRKMSNWWDYPVGCGAGIGDFNGIETGIVVWYPSSNIASLGSRHLDLRPGEVHHLVVERQDRRLTLEIDGRVFMERDLLLPLAGQDLSRVVLRTWAATTIRSLRVLRRSLAPQASPLVAGDALFAAGHALDAVQSWREVAAEGSGEIAAEALAKSYLVARTLGASVSASMVADLRKQLETDHPDSPFLVPVEEADAVAEWRSGSIGKALDLVERVLRRNPDSQLVLALLDGRDQRGQLSRPQIERFISLVGRSREISRLDLTYFGIEDLTPLANLPLRFLELRGNRIRDLTPVRSMPLQELRMSDNQISDLRPLQGKPFLRLNLDNNQIADLSPLAGSRINDLSIRGNPITSLAALRGMPLRGLWADNIQVSDLEPLRGAPLEDLTLRNTKVESAEPLAGIRFVVVDLSGTLVTDLSPLAQDRLFELNLFQCPVSDLGPLTRAARLERLDLGGTQVSDLRPLASLPLTRLALSDTPVSDLAPLSNLPLKEVFISRTQVRDLGPVVRPGLLILEAVGTPIEAVGPLLSTLPGWWLIDQASPIRDRLINDLEAQGLQPAMTKDLKLLRAAQDGDRATLRSGAPVFAGHSYRWVPGWFTFAEAIACAHLVGGHVVTVDNLEEAQFLDSIDPRGSNSSTWLDLRLGTEGRLLRLDGIPATFRATNIPDPAMWVAGRTLVANQGQIATWWSSDTSDQDLNRLLIEWED